MSFLNKLKQQAQSLQSQQTVPVQDLAANTATTETACRRICIASTIGSASST